MKIKTSHVCRNTAIQTAVLTIILFVVYLEVSANSGIILFSVPVILFLALVLASRSSIRITLAEFAIALVIASVFVYMNAPITAVMIYALIVLGLLLATLYYSVDRTHAIAYAAGTLPLLTLYVISTSLTVTLSNSTMPFAYSIIVAVVLSAIINAISESLDSDPKKVPN